LFFSQNSIFFSPQISQQCFSSGLSAQPNGTIDRIDGGVFYNPGTMALFIRLIIRLFQFVFSAGTVFFYHNKSVNSVFQPAYQHSRTAPISVEIYFATYKMSKSDSTLREMMKTKITIVLRPVLVIVS
jgi:hypothetical protein